MPKILIIDDEEPIRISLRGILEDEAYTVLEAPSAEAGIELIAQDPPDLVFLDIWLPGLDGLAALEQLTASHPHLPIIMISGHGNIETAITAIKQGAYDFIEKPLSLGKVLITADRALEARNLRQENQALRSFIKSSELIGESSSMQAFKQLLQKVAPTEAWVLLTGENGTGKELAARAVHAGSKRHNKPLVSVNCAAIPEELIESELFGHEKGAFTGADELQIGRFEMAHQGTIFLDEIGDMSLKTQAKILRILQEQSFERVGSMRTIKVDVRVIAATNKDLGQAILAGTFREDLYYRLRVVPLHLPPLRDREQDIVLLLNNFNQQLSKVHMCKPSIYQPKTLQLLKSYAWPGNVRELRNFVERMIIMHPGQQIHPQDLPSEIYTDLNQESQDPLDVDFTKDFKRARAEFESKYLSHKLEECGGNITRLAESIGLERSYLHRKLKSYNICTD